MNDLNAQIEAIYDKVNNDPNTQNAEFLEETIEVAADLQEYITEAYTHYLKWEQALYVEFKAAGFNDTQSFQDYCKAVHSRPERMAMAFASFLEGWAKEDMKNQNEE